MKSLSRIFAILLKEVRQLRRDRLTFGMIVGIPILQIILFGYAINTDVRHIAAAVADQAATQLSRQLIEDMQATQVIDVVQQVTTGAELKELLDRGEISVGILIPPDFERRLQQQDRKAVQLLVDGSDPIILATTQARSTGPFAPWPIVRSTSRGSNPGPRKTPSGGTSSFSRWTATSPTAPY